jgi:crotonobetainyl-CoA:carnitine CoA-transferase CaiB-like acyl-CoA transferase
MFMTKGLEGVIVVELMGYVAGPACARVLAEMGATVYKIETITGDEYRTNGPGFGMEKTEIDDPAFDLASMNKEWLSVDLKTEAGMEFLHRLLADADIVLTSFRDKALERLGLDYETLHERYPSLVWAQMRGYGERGPEKDTKGFDATAYSSRGGAYMVFPQNDEHFQPSNVPAAFGDWQAGVALSAGVLAALVRKERTGIGDKVTVNLYHMACWAMQTGIASKQFGEQWPRSRTEMTCPTNNTYMSKDGVWFLICYGSYDIYFESVMTSIGLSHLVDDDRYNNLETINKTGANTEVIALMEEAFKKHDWEYWQEVFRENEIPFAKLNTFDDILEDEEAYANDILRPIDYKEFGQKSLVTTPIRLKSVGDPVLSRSRPVGYDTKRIMIDYGYSDQEIEAIAKDGIVKFYEGEELDEIALKPSFGPHES